VIGKTRIAISNGEADNRELENGKDSNNEDLRKWRGGKQRGLEQMVRRTTGRTLGKGDRENFRITLANGEKENRKGSRKR